MFETMLELGSTKGEPFKIAIISDLQLSDTTETSTYISITPIDSWDAESESVLYKVK